MGKKSNQARFPLARIKKMIQQDEDVGKVAQATPIVVSKALELFLASLVNSCVKDAEARGSTKLTPYGLKRAVNTTAMLDFCADIVESIPDPLEGEEDDDEAGGAAKKKRGSGKKRAGAGAEGDKSQAAAAPRKRASRKAKKDDDSDDFIDDDDAGSDPAAAAPRSTSKPAKYGDDDDYEED
ncbi:hypothetical protein JCM8115_001904 [Rhodotorula mucilaginosa]|uniref:Transcription factor CBF/NF-Y/archaeal histone domain-containing protein n=1 Tax=Rhodotorula mucilaginosa TaxID=5537 RepID=A0A9P7B6P3_RHOMI|nr:hypothetical protein C6P46_002999 [Rhodotorula mucilaginosa]TKA53065.1 hypothetical protein B0A53_03945 [Rhodotorula sp. CCFEE 5036]